jgi:hypothetical protein
MPRAATPDHLTRAPRAQVSRFVSERCPKLHTGDFRSAPLRGRRYDCSQNSLSSPALDSFFRQGFQVSWLGTLIGAKPSASRRCTDRTTPLLPGCRIEGIVARKKKLKIREIIVTPEQFISYHHRRYAEYSLGNRLIRLRPELAPGSEPAQQARRPADRSRSRRPLPQPRR